MNNQEIYLKTNFILNCAAKNFENSKLYEDGKYQNIISLDDLISIGFETALKAAITYREKTRAESFESYWKRKVKEAMNNHCANEIAFQKHHCLIGSFPSLINSIDEEKTNKKSYQR